jgi:hypothetical protein
VYEDVQNVTQIAGLLLAVLGKFKIVLNFLQVRYCIMMIIISGPV